MPSEGPEARSETGKPAEPPKVVHADGTLTVTEDTVEIEVTRGGGFRGMIAVPLDRCTLRVMGRAIAVFDEGRLVHLCSRSKPAAEVASLVARVGDRATVEPRTSFASLLALREESAAYRAPRVQDEADAAPPSSETSAETEVPPGHESLRRVYLSQAAMDRDSRRLRAAGWVAHQVSLNPQAPTESGTEHPGRLRGLLRTARPSREATEGVIIWIRPLQDS